ncbi:hypothetical protein HK098_004436 [Nowakowskiella sp. JEL0407]|nr:hypothetical protein HK098_004436 [Nowakowskiella sp. JEL0407]
MAKNKSHARPRIKQQMKVQELKQEVAKIEKQKDKINVINQDLIQSGFYQQHISRNNLATIDNQSESESLKTSKPTELNNSTDIYVNSFPEAPKILSEIPKLLKSIPKIKRLQVTYRRPKTSDSKKKPLRVTPPAGILKTEKAGRTANSSLDEIQPPARFRSPLTISSARRRISVITNMPIPEQQKPSRNRSSNIKSHKSSAQSIPSKQTSPKRNSHSSPNSAHSISYATEILTADFYKQKKVNIPHSHFIPSFGNLSSTDEEDDIFNGFSKQPPPSKKSVSTNRVNFTLSTPPNTTSLQKPSNLNDAKPPVFVFENDKFHVVMSPPKVSAVVKYPYPVRKSVAYIDRSLLMELGNSVYGGNRRAGVDKQSVPLQDDGDQKGERNRLEGLKESETFSSDEIFSDTSKEIGYSTKSLTNGIANRTLKKVTNSKFMKFYHAPPTGDRGTIPSTQTSKLKVPKSTAFHDSPIATRISPTEGPSYFNNSDSVNAKPIYNQPDEIDDIDLTLKLIKTIQESKALQKDLDDILIREEMKTDHGRRVQGRKNEKMFLELRRRVKEVCAGE